MKDVNIKDYLEVKTKSKENNYMAPTYNYSIIFDNGCDLIIRRESGGGIKKDLSIIPSNRMVFIRDVKTGTDKVVVEEKDITSFFRDCYNSINFEKFLLETKNSYFHKHGKDVFAEAIIDIIRKPIISEFIKRGLNPFHFISSFYSNDLSEFITRHFEENNSQVLKIINLIKDNPELPLNILLHLLSIAETFNYNNAKFFVESLQNSDVGFSLLAISYGNILVYRLPNLVKKYNLNFRSFVSYLFSELYTQGISNIDEEIITIYEDMLEMQTLMYDGKIKDKYPKHLKEVHDKTRLVFRLNEQYFKHKKAEKLLQKCKEYEFSDGDYCIVTPETSVDLINEGIDLHHCVGSYVNKVNNGETSILFLRKSDTPEESLITIEYRDDIITQVRGLCEREMDTEERKFFEKWTKKFKINSLV